MTQLQDHIGALQSCIAAVPDADLGSELIGIRQAIDRLEALFAGGLRRFDSVGAFGADGAVTTVSWLRWQCRLSPGAAAERLAVARRLAALPRIEAALANGEIGYQHAAVIAKTAEDIGDEAAQKREEESSGRGQGAGSGSLLYRHAGTPVPARSRRRPG